MAHSSHARHASGMGGMPEETEVPDLFYVQRMYWVVIGAAISFATLVNLTNKVLALQRYCQSTIPHVAGG
jgi:hypothetical protein